MLAAGASILHLHARDAEGQPAWQPEIYQRIFEGIRRHRPDAVLVATTSGRQHNRFEQRSAVLDLEDGARPDMASLTLGSLNFPTGASVNSPEMVQALCTRMRERGITPELEAFDLGMVNYAFFLQRRGFLPKVCYINLLLGSLGTVPGRVEDLAALAREIPGDWTWAGAGIGRYQLPINTAAILMGGHVRVGLEDNAFYDHPNRVHGSNRQLVERVVRLCGELGRPVATCAETRKKLRLGDPANWNATQVSVRKMRPEDLDAALALLAHWNMLPRAASPELPDPELDRLEVPNAFVAELEGRIVGVGSWLRISDDHGETASLAVQPDLQGCGIGFRLQEARLAEMRAKGIRRVRTEADRPEVVHWYVSRFGYRLAGTLRKKHSFGRTDCDHWTLLDLDLVDDPAPRAQAPSPSP
jgi:3-keto-5-aminohexanoate cleavage enzyme